LNGLNAKEQSASIRNLPLLEIYGCIQPALSYTVSENNLYLTILRLIDNCTKGSICKEISMQIKLFTPWVSQGRGREGGNFFIQLHPKEPKSP
jgi:hypothetical protein